MSTQLQEDEHVEEHGLVTASPDNMSEASGDEEDEHVDGTQHQGTLLDFEA